MKSIAIVKSKFLEREFNNVFWVSKALLSQLRLFIIILFYYYFILFYYYFILLLFYYYFIIFYFIIIYTEKWQILHFSIKRRSQWNAKHNFLTGHRKSDSRHSDTPTWSIALEFANNPRKLSRKIIYTNRSLWYKVTSIILRAIGNWRTVLLAIRLCANIAMKVRRLLLTWSSWLARESFPSPGETLSSSSLHFLLLLLQSACTSPFSFSCDQSRLTAASSPFRKFVERARVSSALESSPVIPPINFATLSFTITHRENNCHKNFQFKANVAFLTFDLLERYCWLSGRDSNFWKV